MGGCGKRDAGIHGKRGTQTLTGISSHFCPDHRINAGAWISDPTCQPAAPSLRWRLCRTDRETRMQSQAKTVADYLQSLPDDRRAAIETVRNTILANLDGDYEEGMQYGMIGYYVPHKVFPAGYHCDPRQPLPFAALASQKNHMSLYLMGVYCGCAEGASEETVDARWFRAEWAKTGKKLDMGKACVRFKKLDDVPLDVVGKAIKRIPAKAYLERYAEVMAMLRGAKPSAKAKKPAATAAKALAKGDAKNGPKAGAKAATRHVPVETTKTATADQANRTTKKPR
jgi:hypothetical protein